jgi:hypothetical protein
MHVKFRFSFELLRQLFQTGAKWPPKKRTEVLEGFPEDAVLVGVEGSPEGVTFLVETTSPGPDLRVIVIKEQSDET